MSEFPRISLKAARINCGMTQEEAAKALHIGKSTLINYENGKRVPNWTVVKRIEELYHIPADYLLFA